MSPWANLGRLRVVETAAGAVATDKLVANPALAVSLQGLVKSLRLGSSGGLDLEMVLTTLERTAFGLIAAMKGDTPRSDDFSDTQSSSYLLLKDTRLKLDASRYALPALTSAAATLPTAQGAGPQGRRARWRRLLGHRR